MDIRIPNLVSVIIPTCNRQVLLHQAIDSVLKQSYKNVEVIIVDDNSTAPLNFEQFRSQSLIKYHRNHISLGGAKSRNIGFELSSGEYICFLDDDDRYCSTKIELLIKELKKENSLDAVFGKIIKKSAPNRRMNSKYLDREHIIKSLNAIGYLHTNSSLIRRDVFARVKFDEELEKFQDTQLHIELVNKFKCKYVDIPVAYWNDQHGLNQVTDLKTETQFLKSIKNYQKLKDNLIKRKSISLFYNWYMIFKLMYMKGLFSNKFTNQTVLKVSCLEKVLVSLVTIVQKRGVTIGD